MTYNILNKVLPKWNKNYIIKSIDKVVQRKWIKWGWQILEVTYMFNINLKKSRLAKGLKTCPFALNAFARTYGITLKFYPSFLNAYTKLNVENQAQKWSNVWTHLESE